jgi:hypothetical protein
LGAVQFVNIVSSFDIVIPYQSNPASIVAAQLEAQDRDEATARQQDAGSSALGAPQSGELGKLHVEGMKTFWDIIKPSLML